MKKVLFLGLILIVLVSGCINNGYYIDNTYELERILEEERFGDEICAYLSNVEIVTNDISLKMSLDHNFTYGKITGRGDVLCIEYTNKTLVRKIDQNGTITISVYDYKENSFSDHCKIGTGEYKECSVSPYTHISMFDLPEVEFLLEEGLREKYIQFIMSDSP